jgi:hypothetical protein
MIRKRWAERMGSMVTYLRGHGFVANWTATGIVASHPKGITVTVNERRMKWEAPAGEDPVVSVSMHAPPSMEWLVLKVEEAHREAGL